MIERVRIPKAREIEHHDKPCAFCKHNYVNPCDATRSKKCQNFLFLQSQGTKGSKKSKPRK